MSADNKSPEAVEQAELGLTLWRLYSGGKTAYIVGSFPRQEGIKHAAFHQACAAWPAWTGEGSGSCEAGPGALLPANRESEVLLLPGTGAPDLLRERDALREKVDAFAQQRDALQEDLRRAEAAASEERRGLADCQAEVERLQAERETDAEIRSTLNAAGLQAAAREEVALRQRDALADALMKVRARLPRWILNGIEVGRTGRDADLKGAFADEIETALRLAGRLP